MAAAYLSTPSTEILGVAEVSFELDDWMLIFDGPRRWTWTHKFMFSRICSFSKWVESYDCVRLIFCGFFRKDGFFTGKLLALTTSQLPAAVSGSIASSCLASRDRIRRGDKEPSECVDFWGLLTLKEIFRFLYNIKTTALEISWRWYVNICHWYVNKMQRLSKYHTGITNKYIVI